MQITYGDCFNKYFNNIAWRIKKFVIYFLENELKTGDRILDIGSGTCQYRQLFINKGIRYLAMDFSRDSEHIDVISDALTIPFKNGKFDAVMNTQVLEHLKEPSLFFNECYRVLKQNGKLFLTTNMAYKIHMEPHNYFFFTKYGLRYLAEKNNFKVNFIEPQGGAFQVFSKSLLFMLQSIKSTNKLLYYFCLALFCIPLALITLLCSFLDFLDKDKLITLNYGCYFQKI